MPDRFFDKHHIDPSHFFFNHRIKISEHGGLYLTNTIRYTAFGLIGVFLPIYIFQIAGDYPLFSQTEFINNVSWILSFYFLASLSALIYIFAFSNFIFKRLHLNTAIFLSLIIVAVEVALWIFAAQNLYLIWIAGFLGGFRKVFYWLPYHIMFEKKFRKLSLHFGKSTARRQFLVRAISGVTPAIGGLIAATAGFQMLFMVSIGLLLLAGLPMLFVVKDWKHDEHNPVEIFKKLVLNKKYKLISAAHFGQGTENIIMSIFWPLVMFFVLVNFEKIGFLSSASYIVAAFTTLLVGKAIDKKGPKLVYALGIIINSILYAFKIYLVKPISVYAVDIMDRAGTPFYAVPSISTAYEKAEKIGRSDYHIYREMMFNIGRIAVILVAFVFLFTPINWRYIFIFGMIGGAMSYLINYDKN